MTPFCRCERSFLQHFPLQSDSAHRFVNQSCTHSQSVRLVSEFSRARCGGENFSYWDHLFYLYCERLQVPRSRFNINEVLWKQFAGLLCGAVCCVTDSVVLLSVNWRFNRIIAVAASSLILPPASIITWRLLRLRRVCSIKCTIISTALLLLNSLMQGDACY